MGEPPLLKLRVLDSAFLSRYLTDTKVNRQNRTAACNRKQNSRHRLLLVLVLVLLGYCIRFSFRPGLANEKTKEKKKSCIFVPLALLAPHFPLPFSSSSLPSSPTSTKPTCSSEKRKPPAVCSCSQFDSLKGDYRFKSEPKWWTRIKTRWPSAFRVFWTAPLRERRLSPDRTPLTTAVLTKKLRGKVAMFEARGPATDFGKTTGKGEVHFRLIPAFSVGAGYVVQA